jgi:predicted transposase/invertase (TIGR01784 family)
MNENKSDPKHDEFFKSNVGDKKVAKEIIKAQINKELASKIDYRTMQKQPTEFIQKNLKRKIIDVLYSVKIKGKDAYLYFLLEHQSTADDAMLYRLFLYIVEIMKQHSENGVKKFPLVVPVVVYHGTTSPYPYDTDFNSMYEDMELAKAYAFKSFGLIDLTVMSDQDIAKLDESLFFEYIMKHIREKDFFDNMIAYIDRHPDKAVYFIASIEKLNQVLCYIEASKYSSDKKINKLLEILDEKTEGESVTIIEKRIAQGVFDTRHEIALEMLKNGQNIEMVMTCSKLSKSEVEQLESQLKH